MSNLQPIIKSGTFELKNTAPLAEATLGMFLMTAPERLPGNDIVSMEQPFDSFLKMSKYPIHKSEEEWLVELGEERFNILRKKGTERPFTGEYNLNFEDGTYKCGACSSPLFESNSKFQSDCGWPSFDESIEGRVEYVKDASFETIRTEILCANCGSHLGHVFDDGPTKTGQRYCVNSLSVDFQNK
jgi:peptide-methionine (R)-S-oxide reductase